MFDRSYPKEVVLEYAFDMGKVHDFSFNNA